MLRDYFAICAPGCLQMCPFSIPCHTNLPDNGSRHPCWPIGTHPCLFGNPYEAMFNASWYMLGAVCVLFLENSRKTKLYMQYGCDALHRRSSNLCLTRTPSPVGSFLPHRTANFLMKLPGMCLSLIHILEAGCRTIERQ